MRTSLVLMLALGAATGAGCGKKKPTNEQPAAGSATAGSTAGSGAGTATDTTGGTTTATTTAGAALKPINECPPALKGNDTGLSRTIPSGCMTSVEGDYYVDGELIVESGAMLHFKPDAALYVGYSAPSKLIVKGTADKPAIFTTGGDAAPGVWKGVHLYRNAARSQVSGLVIEYAATALELEAPEVTIANSTFKAAKDAGVKIGDDVTVAAFTGNTFDAAGATALSVPPAAMIGLGAGNKLAADATIELRAGNATASGTWPNLGAPVRVSGEVYVDGKPTKTTITIAAGSTYKFDGAGGLYAGYTADAELKLAGTAEAPVTLDAAGDAQPGAWDKGVIAYSHGTITAEHAIVRHGGGDGKGALRAEGGKLAITASAIKDNVVGVSLDDAAELVAFDQNQLAGNQDQAVLGFPQHLGAMGAGNTYDTDQKVLIRAGNVEKPMTWAVQKGATITIDGEVYVDGGAVTIPAGAAYTFTDSGGLYVGYAKDGSLIVQGTAGAPVTFKGARDDAGAWKGVELYSHAVGTTIANLVVRDAATSGVRVTGGAVTVDGLTCAKCEEAALTWDCAAKVTQSKVKGSEGTPKGALAPTDC